jgi:hypothetical protein|nr:MAG TPA: hypothetical protein [Caudoviricetes sp.]
MYSIQTQNREIIYYRPKLRKLYILERNPGSGTVFNVRAVINEDDCLLGTYSKKEKAQEVMRDLAENDFWDNDEIYSMPEDETVCQ